MRRLATSALRSPRLRSLYYAGSRVPGVRRVQRRILRTVLPVGELRWVTVPNGRCAGMEMLLDPRSEIGYLRGDHEPWLQDLLSSWLEPGDGFYDIGAHVGFFSLLAARLVGPSGRVVALEPDPRTHERLRQHVDRNHLAPPVEPIQAAAWSSAGRMGFTPSLGDAGVTGAVAGEGADGVSVEVIRLDDLGETAPAVIKLDVEGGEVEALKGSARMLAQRRTRWMIETHGEWQHDEAIRMLREAGYQVTASQPRHPTYSDYRQSYLFATP